MYKIIIAAIFCFLPCAFFSLPSLTQERKNAPSSSNLNQVITQENKGSTIKSQQDQPIKWQEKNPQLSYDNTSGSKDSKNSNDNKIPKNIVEKDNLEETDEEFFPNLPLNLDEDIINKKKFTFNTTSPQDKNNKDQFNVESKANNTQLNNKENNTQEELKIKDKNRAKLAENWRVPETYNATIKKEYVILPQSISRTKYDDINSSLPKAVYIKDYKKLIFKEIKTNNINGTRALIDKIDDLEFRDNQGNTPLLYAIIQNKVDIVRLLISKKANPYSTNLEKNNAFDIARLYKRLDIIDILDSSTN